MKQSFVFMRFLAALLVLVLAALAAAQDDPAPPPSNVTPAESSGKRVKGLAYDAATQQQDVVFTFTVPSQGATNVKWTIDGTAVTAAQGSTSCSYTAVGVGRHTIAVAVYHATGLPSLGSTTFAAIGGPVMIDVQAQSVDTFHNDYNDATQSYFLTYYGYSHASSRPDKAQDTQDAEASVGYQIQGTTITWSIPASTYSSGLQHLPHSQGIDIEAEGSFQDGPVHASFHYDDGAGLSGDANDDSSSTEVTQDNVSLPLVYKISGHKPDHLTGDPQNPAYYIDDGLDLGYDNYAQAEVRYKLHDAFGGVMPGVWVQERFIDGNPLDLEVNDDSIYWTTKLVSALDQSVADEDGYFDGWDHLSYTWDGTMTLTTLHEYFGGTTSITSGGVSLGVYKITFTPGNPYPTQSGNANQSKNP